MNSPKEETSKERQNDEMDLDEPYQNEERSSRIITETINRRIEQEAILEQEDLKKYIEESEENNSETIYETERGNYNIGEINWKKNKTPEDTDSERDERDSNEEKQIENKERRIITERRKEKQPESLNSPNNNYSETNENRSFGWM